MKKKIAVLVVLMLILGMSMQVSASEKAVGSLAGCMISISSASNGVRVVISTSATATADVIGVKDIVLQEKVNGSWKNIDIAGGSVSNSADYSKGAVYTGAVKGRVYRAYCTHYATYGGTTVTAKGQTGELVFN